MATNKLLIVYDFDAFDKIASTNLTFVIMLLCDVKRCKIGMVYKEYTTMENLNLLYLYKSLKTECGWEK